MEAVIELGFVALGILAARGGRAAYLTFVILGISFFPVRAGFNVVPLSCGMTLSIPLALLSLTNYGHIVRFGWFFIMTRAQFRRDDRLRSIVANVGSVG